MSAFWEILLYMISFAGVIIGISFTVDCCIKREIDGAISTIIPTVILSVLLVLKLSGVSV